MGFIIMFGALFAKSWRVYRLYSNPSLNAAHLGDLELFLQLSIFVIIMIILLIALSIAGEPAATYFNLDQYRPYKNYIDCSTAYPGRFTGALSAVLVYAGLVTLVGLFVAWRVRDIPNIVFDESQTIGFSIYSILYSGVLPPRIEGTCRLHSFTLSFSNAYRYGFLCHFTVSTSFEPSSISPSVVCDPKSWHSRLRSLDPPAIVLLEGGYY